MKNIIKIFVALTIALVLFGCGKKENKKLYVGTNAEYPPFEYLEGDKITGFDIELIEQIAKIIGKDIEIKNMTFDGLLPALQAKTIDLVIAGMVPTEERKKNVSFTDVYHIGSQVMMIKKDNDTIKTFADLKGKKVGVVLGVVADMEVSKMEGLASIERFNNTSETLLALKSGKIDAVVLAHAVAFGYAKQNPDIKVSESEMANDGVAMALRNEDTKLIEEINKALSTLRENGVYDELVKKYFE